MAGIFADEGITGTQAKKRPQFLKMIRLCRQGKIDVILTKSLSRFARNTVDSLNYIRELRTLGIAVISEKENINTLTAESEMLITIVMCSNGNSITAAIFDTKGLFIQTTAARKPYRGLAAVLFIGNKLCSLNFTFSKIEFKTA